MIIWNYETWYDWMQEQEKQLLREVLKRTNGNVMQTAEKLNLIPNTIYKKIDRHNLRSYLEECRKGAKDNGKH